MATKVKHSKIRKFAISLQIIIYAANGAAWVISVLAFTCGFVIGLGNDTIQLDLDILDLAVTTPATIFIIYGLLLTLVTSVGCCSSISAKLFISLFYIILIICYFLFDVFLGYWVLILDTSILTFYQNVNKSLNGYDDTNAPSIGIIPLHPFVYWNHLQKRGKCCGFESFEDWRHKPYALKEFNIPDSCCNDEYDYKFCGSQIFKHPDTEHHCLSDILHKKGCLHIFPEAVQLASSSKLTYIGRFVGCLLVLCGVLTLVIIALLLSKKLRFVEQGLDNLQYIESKNELVNPEGIEESDGEMHNNHHEGQTGRRSNAVPVPLHKKIRNSKVHPEVLESGDRRRSSDPNSKRVAFKESGPLFIPNSGREHSDHSEEHPVEHPNNTHARAKANSLTLNQNNLATIPPEELRKLLREEYINH